MTKKVITFPDNSTHTVYYENNDDNTVVKFSAGGRTVTSHSKTDSFGRKVFDELQLETGFVSRQYSYMPGAITDEHKDNYKIKSTATTQLVSQIALSDGRTLSYEYDKEERITKVVDSVDGTTEYTYDALGQLVTETVNGVVINSMEYDNYGNITKKNDVVYTYGDTVWKDKLTKVGTKEISYDDQGNPTSYLGHTLTWEKGRQLKSFDSNTYTYNANGIRTSKTVNGIKHEYTLDGTKILRETWGDNTLVPLYDNEDSVCGIIYNTIPYYFIKNLQGDVVSIVDKDADVVARYSYDAWGKVTSITGCNIDIANINPFRYRSYYFDREIELYYLQSRYYDVSAGRFVNLDIPEIINNVNGVLDSNLFCYCCNGTTNYQDCFGYFAIAIGAGVTISFGTAAALIALTIFAFAYIFDRDFRNAVNQLFTMLVQGVIDGVGYLSNVISETASKAKKGQKYYGNEVHHIVAQSDYRAASTRSFIGKYGISTSSSYNLVTIKKTLHKHLHTNAYHAAVELVLRSCADKKRSYSDKKYAIIAGLVLIGALLKSTSKIC